MKFIVNKAFSVIEILVIIAIASIIAALGHQVFISYLARAKVSAAIHVLDEYQANAMSQFNRNGSIAPYYVLFSAGDSTGWVSGVPAGTSAVKTLNTKYVSTISATSGTAGSNTYILLGVTMVHDREFVSGADRLYMAGVIDPDGVITWSCGASASNSDNINTSYLPNSCLSTLP
jgi:type II secretory pathway pseudopilin PulG